MTAPTLEPLSKMATASPRGPVAALAEAEQETE